MYDCVLQGLEELPLDVARQCSGSAGALRGACADVDAGRQDDHPKLAALRRALMAARTLQAVRGHRCYTPAPHVFHSVDLFRETHQATSVTHTTVARLPEPHVCVPSV